MIWTATFISLGRTLGPEWGKFHTYFSKYLISGILIISLILIIIYVYRKYKEQIIKNTYKTLNISIITFRAMGKRKGAIAATVVSLGLLVLLIV